MLIICRKIWRYRHVSSHLSLSCFKDKYIGRWLVNVVSDVCITVNLNTIQTLFTQHNLQNFKYESMRRRMRVPRNGNHRSITGTDHTQSFKFLMRARLRHCQGGAGIRMPDRMLVGRSSRQARNFFLTYLYFTVISVIAGLNYMHKMNE